MDSIELLQQVCSGVEQQFAPYVYPVYGLVEENDPVFIGTCFAITYRNRKFLITAAHVSDDANKASLAFINPATGRLELFEGKFYVSNLNGKSREEDPLDFAWHELTVEEAQKIGCIAESELDQIAPRVGDKRVHVAMGFPRSKNKKLSPNLRRAFQLKPVRAQYSGTQFDATDFFERSGMSSKTHVAIVLDNRSSNFAGEDENTIGYKGLSGGPMIDSGMRTVDPWFVPPRVVGMVIERNSKLRILIGVHISVILRHIDAVYRLTEPDNIS